MSILDFFMPSWKKSDPEVRLRSVRTLDPTNQLQHLFAVARNDSDLRVRKAAIERINDLETLAILEEEERDTELQKLLKQKVDASALQLLKQTLNPASIDRWISRITDNSALETLLHNAELAELRLLCVEKINRPQPLAHTARQDKSEKVAKAAVEKIEELELLQEIFKFTRHPSVKEIAESKIQIQSETEERKRSEMLRLLRVDALLASMRRFSEERHLLSLSEEIEELIESWKELQEVASEEQAQEFEQYKEIVEEKLTRAREKEREEEAKRAVEHANQQQSESMLAEIKELLASPEGREEAIALFKELRNFLTEKRQYLSQSALATLEPEVNALADRIRQIIANEESLAKHAQALASQKMKEEREAIRQAARQQADAAKKAFHEKLDQLEELIEKVRQLKPEAEFDAAAAKFKEYQNQWFAIVGEEKEKFGKAWKRFRQAASSFSQLEEWEQWHHQLEREKLLEEAEALEAEEDEATILKEVKRLREGWRNTGTIAREQHKLLKEKFNTAIDAALARCQDYLKEKEEERQQNYQLKLALIAEFKELLDNNPEPTAENTQRAKELQEQWRAIGPVPKEHNDEIWQEYRSLSDRFFTQRRAQMKVEKQERQENLEIKEQLCQEAEALSQSEAWGETTKKYKELQDRWKATGPVSRRHSDAIWKRFRAACDIFFDRKRAHFEARESSKKENLEAKRALITRLETMEFTGDDQQILSDLQNIESEWEAIGHIPPQQLEKISTQYHAALDSIYDKLAERSPEIKAKQDNIIKTKRVIVDQAKALAFSNDWKETTNQFKVLQQEWKSMGRAGSREEPLWQEFRKACDDFFERRRDQFDILEQSRMNNYEQKMVLVEQAERLAQRPHDDEARREVKMLRKQWKEIGQVPRKYSDKIWERFNTACDAVFDKEPSDPASPNEEEQSE